MLHYCNKDISYTELLTSSCLDSLYGDQSLTGRGARSNLACGLDASIGTDALDGVVEVAK